MRSGLRISTSSAPTLAPTVVATASENLPRRASPACAAMHALGGDGGEHFQGGAKSGRPSFHESPRARVCCAQRAIPPPLQNPSKDPVLAVAQGSCLCKPNLPYFRLPYRSHDIEASIEDQPSAPFPCQRSGRSCCGNTRPAPIATLPGRKHWSHSATLPVALKRFAERGNTINAIPTRQVWRREIRPRALSRGPPHADTDRSEPAPP
jgi:hypothetical protein